MFHEREATASLFTINTMKNFQIFFKRFAFLLLLEAIDIITAGFVVMKLYHWFIYKIFDLPALSYSACVGIAIFIEVVIKLPGEFKYDLFNREIVYKSFVRIAAMLLSLFMSWVVYCIIR